VVVVVELVLVEPEEEPDDVVDVVDDVVLVVAGVAVVGVVEVCTVVGTSTVVCDVALAVSAMIRPEPPAESKNTACVMRRTRANRWSRCWGVRSGGAMVVPLSHSL